MNTLLQTSTHASTAKVSMIFPKSMGLLLILFLAVLLSAVAVVYVKGENRQLLVDYQKLMTQQRTLNIEYNRLQLEKTTLMMRSRVQSIAEQHLAMKQAAKARMIQL